MSHPVRSWVLGLFVILAAYACKSGPAQDNSETNWLKKCDAGGQCGAGLACVEGVCAEADGGPGVVATNPTGTCIAPDDGSRAGYSSSAGLTWLPDCQGALQREYWRVYAVSADRAAMLPRPDGAPGLGAPCYGVAHPLASIVQKYGLCASATTSQQVAVVNDMAVGDAFAVARYLEAHLVFVATPDGIGIEPFPIPADIVDACNLHAEAAMSAELAVICQREKARLQSGEDIGFTYTGPGAVELVARLNELYGIQIETTEAGTCKERQEQTAVDASFIYLAGAVSTLSAPACVPTCPAVATDSSDSIATLPAGTCQPATSPCSMGASICPCAVPGGTQGQYLCACVSGRWECVITTKSHGVCLPCEGTVDASAE